MNMVPIVWDYDSYTRMDKLERFEKVFSQKKYKSSVMNMVPFVQDYEYHTRMGKLEYFEKFSMR
jgi:hypothetical protein